MTSSSSPSSPSTDPRADRRERVGLAIFGILEILAGLFLALSAVVLAVATSGEGVFQEIAAGGAGAPDRATVAKAALLYAGLASMLVTLGIGSLLPRRWVRPLVLYVASLWLLSGLLLLILVAGFAAMAGSTLGASGEDSESPLGVLSSPLGIAIVLLVFVVLYIGLPGALLLFHRRARLKQALERLDPIPRWTDRCPAPVLSLSFSLAISAAACLPFMRGPIPLFGATLTGAPAALVTAIATLALAGLAVATFRLSPGGWWGSLAMIIVLTIVSVDLSLRLDLSRIGSLDVLGTAPVPASEVTDAAGWWLASGSVLFGVVSTVAILRLRRYFAPRRE